MPELPDILVYIERLEHFIKGEALLRVRLASPFLLRTFDPPLQDLFGARVLGLQRLGKGIVFVFPQEHFLVLHLMIAGRLHWREKDCPIPKKLGLAAFDFSQGSLLLTEAGSKKRAAMYLLKGREQLEKMNPGGLEIFQASLQAFRDRLLSENHTLKRALTDPRLFSGIGNAYSDEILHRARLSPVLLTQKLSPQQIQILYEATREVLQEWIERLRQQTGEGFPEKVTAFHPEMAVHGRYGQPCPVCGSKVQRIRYAANETNYCPTCQTGGKLLADRAISLLLRKDWPKSIEELE